MLSNAAESPGSRLSLPADLSLPCPGPEKCDETDLKWMVCSSEMKQPINIRPKAGESVYFSKLDPILTVRFDNFVFER